MSAANYQLTEEQLLCSICLDVFTDPVTLSCGHNFCKNCITEHLNSNSQRRCPLCTERIDRKHKLRVNTFISDMAVRFRQKASDSSEQHAAKPKPASHDVPTRTKRTALKSCLLLALGLACVAIYSLSSLKTDQLFDTVENVAAGSMCTQHGKPLELYCKNEQMPICRSCADSSHRFHHVVPLKEEYNVKKKELQKTEAKIQQKILERQRRNQEIKHSVKLSKEAADRETADGVQVFTALIQSLERAKAKLIGMIEEKHRTTEEQAKGFTQELEQEISELMRSQAEVEQLSHSKDHLHFLQSFPSLNATPLTKDWTEVSICPPLYEGMLRRAMASAVDQLTETVTDEIKKLLEAELKRVQQFAVDVTLDPDTAHPNLILSDDGKQVHHGDVRKELPDNSKRFELLPFVLGKQSFSCGRFHYDVEVKGKTMWLLGVAKESVNRKTDVELNPENGIWAIVKLSEEYFAPVSHPMDASMNYHIEKVRVFVDYEEGLVSFYDVDSAALLYSFTGCSFTEKLYPLFSPVTSDGDENSAPLIITPVIKYTVN